MDKKKRIFIFAILMICAVIIILAAALKGGGNKVQDVTNKIESSEKDTVLSGLKQELADIRVSDDSLPDMSESEISSAMELLHEKGMQYGDIRTQDLRHANDVTPEVKRNSNEEYDEDDEPQSPLVFWVLPGKIENGYDISDSGSIDLYDWDYAKANYVHDFAYLSRDEEHLKSSIGRAYSELFTDFNTFKFCHGLDADEYLNPGEEGRFVLTRWFKFKDSDKKDSAAVCYVDVINGSNEKRTKRECPITQVLFEI